MADFNRIAITGRLGSDPEVRYLPSGTQVVSFRVANNRYRKNGQDQEARWYKVSIFGKLAEIASDLHQNGSLSRGTQVLVGGEQDIEEWTGKDGTLRYTLTINANDLQVFGARTQQEQATEDDDPWIWQQDKNGWVHRDTGEFQPYDGSF